MALNLGELVGYIRADGSGMRVGLANAQLRMRAFQRDTESRLRDIHDRFRRTDFGAAFRQGLDRLRPVGQGLAHIVGMAAPLGGVALSIGRIAAMLGAAAPAAAGLAAAVGNIAPAAGLAVTAMLALKLATAAVKLGMVGVEDAVTAALDPEKAEEFAEAIKKLAPEAQKFAKGIKALAPQFKKLQQDVQNRMFMGLDSVLKNMGRTTLPVLRKALVNSGDAINQMVKGVGSAASRLAADGVLGKAVSGAVRGLHNLQRIPGQITLGLGQVAAAAAPAFARLTKAAGSAMDRLSAKLTRAFKSGAMEKAIENAIDLIGELLAVAKNVGSILGSVFKAAQVSGGGLIGMLKEITGQLAKAFASPQVQAGLKAIFRVMAQIAKSVGPILVSLLGTLAHVFAVIGPPIQALVKHLGEGLLKIADALGPVLVELAKAFGQVVVLALPLVDLAAELISATLPMLTPLFAALGEVIRAAQPFVQALADNIASQLLPVLTTLATTVLPQLLPFFVQLAERLFPLLTDALIQLAPSLTQLGLALAGLLVELTPLIAKWLEFQITLLDKLMPIIVPLITLLTRLASGGLGAVARMITDFVIPTVQAIADLLRGDFSGALSHAKTLARNVALEIVAYFMNLRDRASGAILGLAAAVGRHIVTMGQNAVRGTMQMVSGMVGVVRSLPGRIRAALPGPSGILYGIGQAIIRGLINGVKSQISSLMNTFSGITASIPDWKGPAETDAKLLTPAGRSVIAGFQRGIAAQLPALRSQLQGITGDVPGMTMGPVSAGAGMPGGVAPQRVVIELRGPQAMRDLIRDIVQVDGRGSVEAAFGSP